MLTCGEAVDVFPQLHLALPVGREWVKPRVRTPNPPLFLPRMGSGHPAPPSRQHCPPQSPSSPKLGPTYPQSPSAPQNCPSRLHLPLSLSARPEAPRPAPGPSCPALRRPCPCPDLTLWTWRSSCLTAGRRNCRSPSAKSSRAPGPLPAAILARPRRGGCWESESTGKGRGHFRCAPRGLLGNIVPRGGARAQLDAHLETHLEAHLPRWAPVRGAETPTLSISC